MVCAQGDRFLDVDSGRDDEYLSAPTQHYTFIFNVLVLMTLFNEVNARRIDSSANVFAGLHRSRMFIVIWTASFVLQASTRCFLRKNHNCTKSLASTPPGMPGTHPRIFSLGGRQREYPPQYYYVLSV